MYRIATKFYTHKETVDGFSHSEYKVDMSILAAFNHESATMGGEKESLSKNNTSATVFGTKI